MELAPVGNGVELLHAERLFGFARHVGKLRAVVTFIDHLMCYDQVMLGIHGDKCSQPCQSAPAGGHGAAVGIGECDFVVRRGEHLLVDGVELLHFFADLGDFLFQMRGLGGKRFAWFCRSAVSSWLK